MMWSNQWKKGVLQEKRIMCTRYEIKKAGRMFRLILTCFILFLTARIHADAAFPPDMEKKPVKVSPLFEASLSDVSFYTDPSLSITHLKGSAEGRSLTLTATKVKDHAIYGDFESGDQTGTGWFALKDFVADPDYENTYATVREGMVIYTDSSLDEVQDKIKKYSGVTVISQEGSSFQVIYQKKKIYGIGWMSEETFANTLVYDGRDKQTMADGTYLFRCGYLDDKNGGVPFSKQTELTKYAAHTWELVYVSDNNYYLKDAQTEKYLTVYSRDRGLSWSLLWAKEPDKLHSLFHLERMNGAYSIQSVSSYLFLAQDEEKKLTLLRYMPGGSGSWRLSALKTIVDKKAPMVFTQYDPQWCGAAYGSEGCMGTAGCGILATVNAVYALSGNYMDVMELADYAVEKHYRIVGNGTDEGIFKAACKKYGRKYNFTWDGHGSSLKQLKKKLAAGDTATVHVQGHYVAIAAYNKKKDKYLMLDSNYLPKREDTAFGDWISPERLLGGALEAQQFYYFKLRDPVLP